MRGPHGRQSASRRCSCRATFAARRESGRSPTSGSEPYGIASGPDGALWFADFGAGKIGRIHP